MGSVFSPYYALARGLNGGVADPENFCAINVALYGAQGRRWTMTERGHKHVQRSQNRFNVGPSQLHWNGQQLVIDIDEVNVPIPMRVRGRVTVQPVGLSPFVTGLDADARHRWGPIAPCSRVTVEMQNPQSRWSGHAYLDSNEGDEPVDRAFKEWDWARAEMANGDTTVIYDVRPRHGPDRVVAQRFAPSGQTSAFTAPPRQTLAASKWRIGRTMRSEGGAGASVAQTLEDTPFYVRSVLRADLLGEQVTAVHETLSIPRLVSLPVRLMLPWRMPRRG